MRRPPVTVRTVARASVLVVIVAAAAVLARQLHRAGHTQGDDFALYLRQARSLFDGDMSQVVADNRFAVLVSDGSFSPIAYPWLWPLLLSPLVHLWGLDYDRLKLVQVAVFCFWLVLLHGIVRRRVGRWVAAALTTVFATAPLYLAHTDQLLSEFTHLAAVALVIWWYDRIRRDATLLSASRGSLVLLGALVTVAFNARRESLVLLGVIGVMVLYDVLADRHGDETVAAGVRRTVEDSWRSMITPFAAFAATTALAQLLLPTDLLPDNGNSASFIDDRVGEYPAVLSEQLGLGTGAAPGVILLIVAAAGAVVGVWRRPTLDIPLVALTVLSAMAIGTHFRQVDRYWFQITPWVGYFATVAVLAGATWAFARRRRLAVAVAIAPLLALSVAHLVTLRGDIDDVAAFHDAGRVQSGPANPVVATVFEAVVDHTPPDAIIAYYRARTMTLVTDRRAFQTSNLDRISANADYYAERRNSTYWQPELDAAAAREAGFEEVWSDQRWILWRVPDPG